MTVAPENAWHNYAKPTDVNNDGNTTPLDALNIINYLNDNGSVALPMDRSSAEPPFYDVSKDGWISPVDAIQIINELNVFPYTVTIGVQATEFRTAMSNRVQKTDAYRCHPISITFRFKS